MDLRRFNVAAFVCVALSALGTSRVNAAPVVFCHNNNCPGKNPLVKSISMIVQYGARPHFSPDGTKIIFDRVDPGSKYFRIHVADLHGNIIQDIKGPRPWHSGFPTYNPNPALPFIVFNSEEDNYTNGRQMFTNDPGIGFFCNLYATNLEGTKFWKLTNTPLKKGPRDPLPVHGVINPHFSPDGRKLMWAESYKNGGSGKFGYWRAKEADFVVTNGVPKLLNTVTLYTAEEQAPSPANYVNPMGWLDETHRVVTGNLSGQPCTYGMDQYVMDVSHLPGTIVTDLTPNTPNSWEETSVVTPDKHIIFMSNRGSKYVYDCKVTPWQSQPVTREWYMVKSDGSDTERLTYFNDPSASEYTGDDLSPNFVDIAQDGKTLVGTIRVGGANARLAIALIQLARPLAPAAKYPK